MENIFTKNGQKLSFWVSSALATCIFFSAWVVSRELSAKSHSLHRCRPMVLPAFTVFSLYYIYKGKCIKTLQTMCLITCTTSLFYFISLYLITGISGKNKTISQKCYRWSMALDQQRTKMVRIVFQWYWIVGMCHQMSRKNSWHWCYWSLQWSIQNLDSESKRRWVNDTQMISWSNCFMNFYSRNLQKKIQENLFTTCKHNFWRIRTSAF